MDYNKISHKVDVSFNKKFKHVISFICVIIIMGIFSPVFSNAYSSSTLQDRNLDLYQKILNYTIPGIRIINRNYSDYKLSLTELIKQKLSINGSICQEIMDREFPMLKLSFDDQKSEEDIEDIQSQDSLKNNTNIENQSIENNETDKDNLTPFKLSSSDILKQENSNDDKYGVDNNNLTLKKKLDINNPEVFIYHTHTCESYKPGNATNPDQSVNVCAVGDVIENELMNNYGICTIHDKTIHDIMYNKSYSRSRTTVQKYLNKYKNLKLIIDLHRDSIDDKSAVTLETGDGSAAKYMFVLDKGNPNNSSNLKLMNTLVSISDRLYPNLIRDKKIYTYNHGILHFNQDLSPNLILIELGSYVNTTEEAKLTAKYLARIIAEYINGR